MLNRDEVRSILSLYHLDSLEDFGGITEGSINTHYWVLVSGRRYFLRITERKRVQDMIFERELLEHLSRAAMPVPRLIENVAKGTFTPWSVRGRFVSLFEYMDGRDLGVFEIRPHHARAVGRFSAKMHLSTQGFRRLRRNEFDLLGLDRQLQRIDSALRSGRLAPRFGGDVQLLADELERQRKRSVDHLPRGTVHGDLFVDNVKFRDGKLSGVIDFEKAATERFTWEIAVALNAWCWEPSPIQRGGPAGRFDPNRTRAFIRGYASVRKPGREEERALADDMRLAAASIAIGRICDHELKKRRAYKDYRHYTERLRYLRAGGAECIVTDALG